MPEADIKKTDTGKHIFLAVLLSILLVHCLGSFFLKLINIPRAEGYRIDFIAYYTAAKLSEADEAEEIYVGVEEDFSVVTSGKYFEMAKRAGFPYSPTRFLYLPIFATPFRLLTIFDFPAAANIWLVINLLCILAILYLEWDVTKEFFPPVSGLIFVVLLNLYSFPLLYGLTLGQTSILIYLIVCRRRCRSRCPRLRSRCRPLRSPCPRLRPRSRQNRPRSRRHSPPQTPPPLSPSQRRL